MQLGAFLASVRIGGVITNEYAVKLDPDRGIATCYIESDVGKVRWSSCPLGPSFLPCRVSQSIPLAVTSGSPSLPTDTHPALHTILYDAFRNLPSPFLRFKRPGLRFKRDSSSMARVREPALRSSLSIVGGVSSMVSERARRREGDLCSQKWSDSILLIPLRCRDDELVARGWFKQVGKAKFQREGAYDT